MAVELPLNIPDLDRSSKEPLWSQLYRALRRLIMQRVLDPGFQMPSTRQLAHDLRLGRNTVISAYDQLLSEGYLETRQGARTIVADLPVAQSPGTGQQVGLPMTSNLSHSGRLMVEKHINRYRSGDAGLRPSTPELSTFPFDVWRRFLQRRFRDANSELFWYNNIAGYPPLRAAIAGYLRAYRGVNCTAEQIFVTNGAQAGLDLLARFLLNAGDHVWMEEPGYRGAQGAFIAAGARLAPLRVGPAGWDLAAGPPTQVKLIYTTPSCHQPIGVAMPLEQRLHLLEIARNQNAWIIEDDFDSEFRIAGGSAPAMQGIDGSGRTIYVGTFSKTLFPAVRIGFIVLPHAISAEFEQANFVSGHFPSLPMQAVLSDFIEEGHFARHLRRVRRLYSTRRAAFMTHLQTHLSDLLDPFPAEAGMQISCRLRFPGSDVEIARRPDAAELNLSPLSAHYYHGNAQNGFYLGYTAHARKRAEELLHGLREILIAARADHQ